MKPFRLTVRPRAFIRTALSLLLTMPAGMMSAAEPAVPDKIEFNRDVRPILAENCFYCHGPDASHRQADLRLDIREQAIESAAFKPSSVDDSELVRRLVSTDPKELMPPADSNKKLSERQKEILRRWIAQGAEYQQHWSYERIVKRPVPAGTHPIDYFIDRQLSQVGLTAVPEADKRTLIRRLSRDLLGLPPSPGAVERFVQDKSADAYERLVDSLLADPHYGERMAVGWLDVVRFADTIGYHSDNPRNVWPYRDWVIQSFNTNKRFDRFTLEQIAGDLLPDANQETRIGSAFNRLLLSTEEGGAQPKDYEARMLTDRVRAVGIAWLGQTTGCAQCHDHKFDPFTMRDFYSLGAFFADIKEPIVGHLEDGMPIVTAEQSMELDKLKTAVEEAQRAAPANKEAIAKAKAELKRFEDGLPKCIVSESMSKQRLVRILPRGNWMDESGETVGPALPHYLPQPPAGDRALTRLDLAQWLVSRDNPLTPRTVMNRLWKQFFGIGLSRVADDLGAQGELPVNGPLLDWLAAEFIDNGWDMKHMVRTIVTSRTYRRSSVADEKSLAVDPNNRYCARQTPFRLDAEFVRDNALTVSGLLVPKIGGPSVKTYQPEGYWENLNFPQRDYVIDPGEAQYRRGMYIWWQRTFLNPSLLAFDAPSREECTADRSRSNIPQQALVLLNDPTYVEAARALAVQSLLQCKDKDETRLAWMFQQAVQREPAGEESKVLLNLLQRHNERYARDPDAARELLKVGFAPLPAELAKEDKNLAQAAAWTHIARVLLNLHESVTRD
ncbi:MAG: PSD1 and planctomycete cytochrome C domain-containing protein [Pirellulales bacterium]